MGADHRDSVTPARLRSEALLARLTGDGWMARAAYRAGLQRPPEVVRLTLPIGAPGAPPLRIVYASDFHAGPTTHPAIVRAACAAIAALAPDLLLLGGDYVSYESRYVAQVAEGLAHIRPPLGSYGVLGNHDIWAGERPIVAALAQAGVTLLDNASARLPAPHQQIWVCGLDDPGSGAPDAARALDGAEGARIVLMHAPAGLSALGAARFELALCGHTHGGQICLPGGRPLFVPDGGLNMRYHAGLFTLGPQRQLLVSRGVGYGGLPLRSHAPPDIVCCTVVPRPDSYAR